MINTISQRDEQIIVYVNTGFWHNVIFINVCFIYSMNFSTVSSLPSFTAVLQLAIFYFVFSILMLTYFNDDYASAIWLISGESGGYFTDAFETFWQDWLDSVLKKVTIICMNIVFSIKLLFLNYKLKNVYEYIIILYTYTLYTYELMVIY